MVKYKVITLCGSTKFKEQFMEAQKELTLNGFIVISPCIFKHSEDDIEVIEVFDKWDNKIMTTLEDMHKQRIDMADEIFVINYKGYIGDSTKSEIEYAMKQGKGIRYMYPDELITEDGHKAVELLDRFTKSFCRDKNVNLFDDLVFRCKECPFEIENGECLVKIFKQKFYPDYKDFGSMGDL